VKGGIDRKAIHKVNGGFGFSHPCSHRSDVRGLPFTFHVLAMQGGLLDRALVRLSPQLLPGALSAIRSPGKSMPTYEYRCEKCNQTFEMFQSMKDDALQVCPQAHCRMETWGRGKVKRLLGAGAGLIFKGSGFYITDYRSQSYSEAAKKESGSKEGGGAKTDSSAPKTTKEKSSSGSGSKSES
jgi:putative FmdB family regulatory protein